jgi:hypothetical protein
MSFAQSGFAQFISTPAGRVLRVVAGLVIIGCGYVLRGGSGGIVLMVVGLVPLLAGALDVCVISGLLGGPWSGAKIRAGATKPPAA